MSPSPAPAPSLLPSFERSVRALADAAIHDHPGSGARPAIADAVARFVLQVHAHMPDYLRLSLRILTLLFDAWPYPTSGRPFHALDRAQRQARIHAWESSRLEARRSLMAFYRSFAVYGLYAELYSAETPAERPG